MVRALLAEAQFDADLAKAFRENWTLPRRKLVYEALEKAVVQGEIRKDLDIEAAIDAFYGPIYYRLQMGPGPITEAYADKIFYIRQWRDKKDLTRHRQVGNVGAASQEHAVSASSADESRLNAIIEEPGSRSD